MGTEIFILEFEFRDRRQVDPVVALSRREAERRAHAVVDDGTAIAARLIPLRRGRAIVIKPEAISA